MMDLLKNVGSNDRKKFAKFLRRGRYNATNVSNEVYGRMLTQRIIRVLPKINAITITIGKLGDGTVVAFGLNYVDILTGNVVGDFQTTVSRGVREEPCKELRDVINTIGKCLNPGEAVLTDMHSSALSGLHWSNVNIQHLYKLSPTAFHGMKFRIFDVHGFDRMELPAKLKGQQHLYDANWEVFTTIEDLRRFQYKRGEGELFFAVTPTENVDDWAVNQVFTFNGLARALNQA